MEKTFKIFIIVLNAGGAQVIKKCLDAVFCSDYQEFEVVVVDAQTREGSFEKARKGYSRARFILSQEKISRSMAFNLGIRYALEKMADLVLLLDSRVKIKKNTLSLLTAEAQRKKGEIILGPVLQEENGKVFSAGGFLNKLIFQSGILTKEKKNQSYRVDYVPDLALLADKKVFARVGLLDERYFFTGSDVDFCWRARRQKIPCLVVPSAKAIIDLSDKKASPQNCPQEILSRLLIFHKNAPFWLKPWLFFYFYLWRPAKDLVATGEKNSRKKEATKTALRAYRKIVESVKKQNLNV